MRRHARIRSVKRVLRYLPRRASLQRYPVLKWFHKSARKRDYLWSFRTLYVQRALFYGCIIAFLPIMGIQIFLASLLALRIKANLAVIVALQWISNPGTVVPLYLAKFKIGSWILAPISDSKKDAASVDEFAAAATSTDQLINFYKSTSWDQIGHVLGSTFLGGLILGLFFAILSTTIFTTIVNRTTGRLYADKRSPCESRTMSEDQD